jgi:hypothetical protein
MKRVTIAAIEPLIDKTNGNIAAIARSLGFSRTAIYNCIAKHPALVQAIEDARQGMLDNVESSLYRAVLDGNVVAMIFYLKTQGKRRGWVERQEITGQDGGPVEHHHITESELDAEIRRLLGEVADRKEIGAQETTVGIGRGDSLSMESTQPGMAEEE